MEHKEDGMLGKLKATISIIYGILLWVARLSSTIKVPHYYYLVALISSISQLRKNEVRTKNSLNEESLLSPSLSYSSSSSSFALSSTGDLIGSESGINMSSSDDALLGEQGIISSKPNSLFRKKKILEKEIGKKRDDFPPPLTSLVSTENLTCRTPWIFERYYVAGRLIVTERRTKRCKYLETYRENGRLVMNLVPLNDAFDCYHSDYESDIDFGDQNDEIICDPFSSDIEGEEIDENQEVGDEIEEIESPILESSNENRCNMEREKSVLKPSFFNVPAFMNKPIYV